MSEAKKAIEQRIRELYSAYGKITPDIVIEDAKKNDSPLHDEFEWDTHKAAMEAWRETARRLIRSVTVKVTTESKTFRTNGYKPPEFVRNPSATSREQSYIRVAEIKSDHEIAVSALMYEIDRINGSLVRARALCIELGLDDEIRIVDDAFKGLRKKVKETA